MKLVAATPDQANLSDVGDKVRAARAKAGMTRKQLAAASGASERYLAQIEGGDSNPSLSVLVALAGALGVSLVELLPLGGERDLLYAEATAAVRRLPKNRFEDLHRWIQRPLQATNQKGRRIVLVGLRGAGKSSLGEALAKQLNVPFFEISKKVEELYGAEIGLLIELNGQAALRRYEAESWEAIRSDNDRAVISMPGGIVANDELYDQVLSTAHSIWLQASPEDHMKRVMAQGDFRPMASNRGAMDDLKAILEARSPEYARADACLNTSKQDFQSTAALLETEARNLIGH
jgi:XRE family aerobic/anaerobic benzoate catabolism transcriptional regulator